MSRMAADTAASTHLRAVETLDVDLLESLEARDRSLYTIVSAVTRYRSLLHEQVQLLRAGKNPEMVRAAIGRWDMILREIATLCESL